MDCHVATLLAETEARLCERSEAIHLANTTVSNHGLPRRYTPRRDSSASFPTLPAFANSQPVFANRHPVIANSIPSLQTPPRHCERSEAIHPSDSAVLNHGLPRPTA